MCHIFQYLCVCFTFGQMFSIMLQHSNILMGNIRRLEDKAAVKIREYVSVDVKYGSKSVA